MTGRNLNHKRHAKDIGWRPIIANPEGSREERRAAKKLRVELDDLPAMDADAAAMVMREIVKAESRRMLRGRRRKGGATR